MISRFSLIFAQLPECVSLVHLKKGERACIWEIRFKLNLLVQTGPERLSVRPICTAAPPSALRQCEVITRVLIRRSPP